MSIARVRRWPVASLPALLAFAAVASAMERPSPEEIARYKQDGSFEERVQRAFEIGNHRVDPRLVADATYRLRMRQWRQGEVAERPTPPPA